MTKNIEIINIADVNKKINFKTNQLVSLKSKNKEPTKEEKHYEEHKKEDKEDIVITNFNN